MRYISMEREHLQLIFKDDLQIMLINMLISSWIINDGANLDKFLLKIKFIWANPGIGGHSQKLKIKDFFKVVITIAYLVSN